MYEYSIKLLSFAKAFLEVVKAMIIIIFIFLKHKLTSWLREACLSIPAALSSKLWELVALKKSK